MSVDGTRGPLNQVPGCIISVTLPRAARQQYQCRVMSSVTAVSSAGHWLEISLIVLATTAGRDPRGGI